MVVGPVLVGPVLVGRVTVLVQQLGVANAAFCLAPLRMCRARLELPWPAVAAAAGGGGETPSSSVVAQGARGSAWLRTASLHLTDRRSVEVDGERVGNRECELTSKPLLLLLLCLLCLLCLMCLLCLLCLLYLMCLMCLLCLLCLLLTSALRAAKIARLPLSALSSAVSVIKTPEAVHI